MTVKTLDGRVKIILKWILNILQYCNFWKAETETTCYLKVDIKQIGRMRWAGYVGRMGRGKVFTGFWLGGPKVGDHWESLGVGGRITLN
jgi:hypothetical protein